MRIGAPEHRSGGSIQRDGVPGVRADLPAQALYQCMATRAFGLIDELQTRRCFGLLSIVLAYNESTLRHYIDLHDCAFNF